MTGDAADKVRGIMGACVLLFLAAGRPAPLQAPGPVKGPLAGGDGARSSGFSPCFSLLRFLPSAGCTLPPAPTLP